MKFKTFTLILIALLANVALKAQFVLDGELRPRAELRDGYKKLPTSETDYAALVTQRTRLNFKFNYQKYTGKITVQDVRIWGDEKLKQDTPSLGMYEAWVELPVYDSLSIKIGRQELIYDNERLLSNNNWQQQAQTHDALLLKYKRNGWRIDFGTAFNQAKDTVYSTDYSLKSIKGNYKTLNFLWITKKINNLKLSAVGIADGFQKAGTTNTNYVRLTYGGVADFKVKKFSAAIRAFYQSGKDVTGVNIAAFYVNSEIYYSPAKQFTFNPGVEIISGKDGKDENNDKINCFSTLYGTGHSFDGHMDYFTDMPKHTKGAGLVDAYLKFTYKLSAKSIFKTDFHYFALENNYLNNGKSIDRYLGTEADVSLKVDFSKEVSLHFGYSAMLAGKSMETIIGGNSNHLGNWGWAMLTIKPTLFSSK